MMRPTVFGYPRLPRLAALAMLALMLVGLAVALMQDGGHDDAPIFLAGAAVALTTALILRTRVELTADDLAVVTTWSSRRFPRGDITAVNWERGSSVVLALRTGRDVSLPSVAGHDPEMAGAIHAWLQEGARREGRLH